MNRPWVDKIEKGEWAYKWNGFEPILITGLYSESLYIGEYKFIHCVGEFNGIGDVLWWELDKIDNLLPDQQIELYQICSYKNYVNKFISYDKIQKIADLYNCETFNIHRVGKVGVINLLKQLTIFNTLILEQSKNLNIDEWFNILSFDDFKKENL